MAPSEWTARVPDTAGIHDQDDDSRIIDVFYGHVWYVRATQHHAKHSLGGRLLLTVVLVHGLVAISQRVSEDAKGKRDTLLFVLERK
jgi:hypothetical protein